MEIEQNNYEKQKKENKRMLVRNEFKIMGKYGIPLIRKQIININKIKLISYVDTKKMNEKMHTRPCIFHL